jgi:uncharacterized protein (DUF2336 family)
MIRFLQNILPGFKSTAENYEKQKITARTGSFFSRMLLARNAKTSQDILYYMAESDPSAKVRKAVARNASTPVHASMILAGDKSVDVRLALAGRLVDLLPGLSAEKHSQLYAYIVQALGTLALDEVLKVRKALASTLKDHAHTPPKVAGQLARDVEREVAEPILRFCAALSDEDLLDILKEHPAGWAVQAIAGRHTVSEEVSEAVIEADYIPAGTALIRNEGASLSSNLLQTIVSRAREYPEWHEPLSVRKSLPPAMAKILAEYVDDRVRLMLQGRADFDEKTSGEIAAVVRRRIEFEQKDDSAEETPTRRVNKLVREGTLNEAAISDGLAMRDREFVILALASLTRSTASDIHKVFSMRAAKPITAMAWKAGLSMRMALRLQQEIGQIPPKELLYPKGGTDYPMTREEIKWQLDFLDLENRR